MASPQTEDGYTKIANELLWEFGKFGFSQIQYQILSYVLRMSYGFNKKTAIIKQVSIANDYNLDRSLVSRNFAKLKEMNALIFAENGELGINKNYEDWQKEKLTNSQQVDEKSIKVCCGIVNKKLTNSQQKVDEKSILSNVIKKKENLKKKDLPEASAPDAQLSEKNKKEQRLKTLNPLQKFSNSVLQNFEPDSQTWNSQQKGIWFKRNARCLSDILNFCRKDEDLAIEAIRRCCRTMKTANIENFGYEAVVRNIANYEREAREICQKKKNISKNTAQAQT
jgi:Bacteriophage replication protein O.